MTTVRNGYRTSDGRFAPKPLKLWQRVLVSILKRVGAK